MCSNEPLFLAQDMLEVSFMKTFAALRLLLLLYGSFRADIRHGFVTPITAYQRLYTLLWIIFVSASFYYFQHALYIRFFNLGLKTYISCVIFTSVLYMAYIALILYARFSKKMENVELYIRLQKIDYNMAIGDTASANERFSYIHASLVIIYMTLYHIAASLMYFNFFLDDDSFGLPWFTCQVVIHGESYMCTSHLVHLAVRVRFMHKVLRKINIGDKIGSISQGIDYNKGNFMDITTMTDDLIKLKSLTMYFRQILKTYEMIVELFAFPMFTSVVTFVVWGSSGIGSVTNVLRRVSAMVEDHNNQKSDYLFVSVVMLSWLVLSFCLIIFVVISCEYITRQLRKCKILCLALMSEYANGPLYSAAKDLHQLIHKQMPVFSVYGIFVVDKHLPLTLISILTSNTVLLLQFTLTDDGD